VIVGMAVAAGAILVGVLLPAEANGSLVRPVSTNSQRKLGRCLPDQAMSRRAEVAMNTAATNPRISRAACSIGEIIERSPQTGEVDSPEPMRT
jgi:hypothetical protein